MTAAALALRVSTAASGPTVTGTARAPTGTQAGTSSHRLLRLSLAGRIPLGATVVARAVPH